MILKEQNNQEIVIGGGKQQSFSIDDSSSMIFDILRNKLYSNKIGAIAREIASNSRDANREAGVDKNIEIEFTNDNFLSKIGDTSIIFRDFGLGISPDRMENIFLKYGASSKRDSNLQTGGFGLGAKVPMAYTDSFVIKTRNAGVEYVYNAIIDATGKGKVILLSEQVSDEHSGTEIIVPILSNDDRYKFEKEVYKYTMHWGNVDYYNFRTAQPKINYVIENEVFRIMPLTDASFIGLLDGIPYEIKPEGVSAVSGYTVLLNLEMDKVTINANRESLQYDEQTKLHVNEKVVTFKESLEQEIQDYLQDNETFLGAYKKFKNIGHISRASNNIEELICTLKPISSYNFNYDIRFNGDIVEKINLPHHSMTVVKTTQNGSKYAGSSFTMDYPIVYLDKGGIRIPKNEKLGEFLLIRPDKSISKDILEKERKYLEDLGVELTNYSEVKADRVYVRPVKSDKIKIYLRGEFFKNDKYERYFDKVTKTLERTKPDEALFIVVDSFKGRYGWSHNFNKEKISILKYEKKVKDIYYVNRSNWEKYLKPAGFKLLENEIEKIDYQKYSKYIEVSKIKSTIKKVPSIILENFPELLPVNILKFKSEEYIKVPAGLEHVRWQRLGFEGSKFDYDNLIKKFEEKLKVNYPMLPAYLDSYYHDEKVKIKNIKDYINQK